MSAWPRRSTCALPIPTPLPTPIPFKARVIAVSPSRLCRLRQGGTSFGLAAPLEKQLLHFSHRLRGVAALGRLIQFRSQNRHQQQHTQETQAEHHENTTRKPHI